MRSPRNYRCTLALIGAPGLLLLVATAPVHFVSPAHADPLVTTSTFFRGRQDVRRCASPLCGGLFVSRVNFTLTRCADGRYASECYVASFDLSALALTGDERKGFLQALNLGRVVVRGTIRAQAFSGFGNLGELVVTEGWRGAGDRAPTGRFYRLRDTFTRCTTFPCPMVHEAKLNSTVSRNIAAVDLTRARVSDALVKNGYLALTGADGLIVAGAHGVVSGPGGTMLGLSASQFYMRVRHRPLKGAY